MARGESPHGSQFLLFSKGKGSAAHLYQFICSSKLGEQRWDSSLDMGRLFIRPGTAGSYWAVGKILTPSHGSCKSKTSYCWYLYKFCNGGGLKSVALLRNQFFVQSQMWSDLKGKLLGKWCILNNERITGNNLSPSKQRNPPKPMWLHWELIPWLLVGENL